MALSAPEEAALEETQSPQRLLVSLTPIEQESHELVERHSIYPDSFIDTQGQFIRECGPSQMRGIPHTIKPSGFPLNYPWLPPNVSKLLKKSKHSPLSEREFVTLMDHVAQRASVHFRLSAGSYAAMTFGGRVVEVSDTRIDLLKKLQGRKFEEQIFVWRIGSDAFSGRI
jgi:hypothetical protein